MASIILNAYVLKIEHKKNKTCLKMTQSEMKEFFDNFVKKHSKQTREGGEHTCRFEPINNNSPSFLHGLVHYGQGGIDSKILDDTGAQAFKRSTSHKEEIPLYYYFHFDDDCDFPLLALQTYGVRSCSSLLKEVMGKEFLKHFVDYRLEWERYIPANEECFDKSVTLFELIKSEKTKDLGENYDLMDEYKKVKYTQSYVEDPRRSLSSVREWFSKFATTTIEGVQVVSYKDEKYDEANVSVKMGKKSRKINIFGGKSMGGRIDISDIIEHEDNGHPKISSIQKEVEEIIEYIIERIRNK